MSKTLRYTKSELEAYGLVARSRGRVYTSDDVKEAANEILALADRIKNERMNAAMQDQN